MDNLPNVRKRKDGRFEARMVLSPGKRLSGYGDAIVPQLAAKFLETIKEIIE